MVYTIGIKIKGFWKIKHKNYFKLIIWMYIIFHLLNTKGKLYTNEFNVIYFYTETWP